MSDATLSAGPSAVREDVPGILNFARVATTVACAGATAPEAIAAVKAMGFVSLISVRQAGETGANVEAQEAAARAAGLAFFHVPFNSASPEAAAADRFLEALASPGAGPACICCATGNRAAALWMIKRVAVDRWDVDRALEEAVALGLTSPTLRRFAIDYAVSRSR